jgi:hypothetical protein
MAYLIAQNHKKAPIWRNYKEFNEVRIMSEDSSTCSSDMINGGAIRNDLLLKRNRSMISLLLNRIS